MTNYDFSYLLQKRLTGVSVVSLNKKSSSFLNSYYAMVYLDFEAEILVKFLTDDYTRCEAMLNAAKGKRLINYGEVLSNHAFESIEWTFEEIGFITFNIKGNIEWDKKG